MGLEGAVEKQQQQQQQQQTSLLVSGPPRWCMLSLLRLLPLRLRPLRRLLGGLLRGHPGAGSRPKEIEKR